MPVTASDHSIHLFFDFEFDDAVESFRTLTSLTIGDLETTWIEKSRLAAAPAPGLAEATVWEEKAMPVSSDLHPFVRAILDSRPVLDPDHPDADADHPHCLASTVHVRNLLAGMYRGEPLSTPPSRPGTARQQRGFALRLGHSKRVAEFARHAAGAVLTDGSEYALPLELDGVRLHLFPTGVALAVLTLHIVSDQTGKNTCLDADLLIEGLPLLCDERRHPTLRWRDNWAATGAEGFSVRDLLLTLTEQCGLIPIQRERIFSFCSLVCEAFLPTAERHETSFRLSRHYNHKYRLEADSPGTDFIRPFENVLHAISSEGSCTIVDSAAGDPQEQAAPLSDWLESSHARVYLPLHTVALHEYIVLLRLAQGAGNHIELAATTARDIAKLKHLCDRFLLFRLRYRLAQVSAITMHGLVYSALEHRLGLRELAEKMSHDLVTVERRLLELAAARRESRWRLPASLIAGGVAFLTLVTVGTRVEDALHAVSPASVAVLVVGILGATLGFFAAWGQQQSAKAALDNSAGIDS